MANSNKTPLENDNSLSSESIFEKTTPPKLTNINKMYKFFLLWHEDFWEYNIHLVECSFLPPLL